MIYGFRLWAQAQISLFQTQNAIRPAVPLSALTESRDPQNGIGIVIMTSNVLAYGHILIDPWLICGNCVRLTSTWSNHARIIIT